MAYMASPDASGSGRPVALSYKLRASPLPATVFIIGTAWYWSSTAAGPSTSA